MKKLVWILLMVSVIMGGFPSSIQGANLHMEPDAFSLQIVNFAPHSSFDDFLSLDIGYGRNHYQGYALNAISGEGRAVLQVEYQFLPEDMRDRAAELQYGFKLGASSGSYWEQDDPAGKAGVIMENELNDRQEIYFDGELVIGDTNWVDLEFGTRGKLGTGIFGVLGYKMVVSQAEDDDAIQGIHYGIKTEF